MNRLGKAAVAAVLVTIPATYLVVASFQSLDGSEMKERVAAATSPLHGRPDSTTRDIYEVPVPGRAQAARFFETNSWRSSSLYVRFTTVPGGLDWFLGELGTSRAELRANAVPISWEQQEKVGWNFHGDWAARQKLYGLRLDPPHDGGPTRSLVVNLTRPDRPAVYVVSTLDF
ncbi:hypothetical protein GCM10027168_22300 [Streptomyces capparidis]